MRMTMVETDDDLSPKGRAKLRADIANEVLAELDQFQPLSKAKNVVARRISNLKEKMVALPGEPTTQKDLAVAGEIRALLRAKGEDAEQFAFSHRTDPKLVAAILGAPAFLSGMSQDAVERLRAVASQALYPAEVEEIAALEAAERVAMQAAEHARERIARRAELSLEPQHKDTPEAE